MSRCKRCGEDIYWMTRVIKLPDDVLLPVENSKFNAIDKLPNPNGNIVAYVRREVYRFASNEEIANARRNRKGLYISHFDTCRLAEKNLPHSKVKRPAETQIY